MLQAATHSLSAIFCSERVDRTNKRSLRGGERGQVSVELLLPRHARQLEVVNEVTANSAGYVCHLSRHQGPLPGAGKLHLDGNDTLNRKMRMTAIGK